jgi:hypothetical protein
VTITHQASTGVNAATSQGSSSTGVAYVGVATGRRALLGAAVYPATNSWSSVTGWTLIGELAGGATGADTNDDHQTKIGVWQRDLDGSETGNVTVANTGGGAGQSTAAAMSSYSQDGSGWETSIFVSGDDPAHENTDHSATFGAWASSLEIGDLVAVWQATDTDNAGAKSAFSLMQTGITFGAVNWRNGSRSNTGSDCAIDSWDATVTAGSNTNAATFSYSYATANCGPFIAVRLRQAAGTHVRLTAPSTIHDQTAANRDAVKLVQQVAGNWDVSVRFSDLPTQNGEGWGLYADGGSATAWLRAGMLKDPAGALRYYAATTETETGDLTVYADTAFPDRYFSGLAFVRLVKSGTQYTFYTSANAIIWHQAARFDWTGKASRLGPMLAKTATASTSVVDVDWFRNTPAAGAITAVFPVDATGVGEGFQPASIDIARFSSAYAQNPQIAIVTNAVEATATGVPAAAPAVSVAPTEAAAAAAALNAVGDPSDLGNLYIDALGSAVTHDPGPSVAVRPAAA